MPYGNPDLGSYRLCRLTKDIMPWSKDVQYQFLSSEDSVRGKVAMESAGLSAAASDTCAHFVSHLRRPRVRVASKNALAVAGHGCWSWVDVPAGI